MEFEKNKAVEMWEISEESSKWNRWTPDKNLKLARKEERRHRIDTEVAIITYPPPLKQGLSTGLTRQEKVIKCIE